MQSDDYHCRIRSQVIGILWGCGILSFDFPISSGMMKQAVKRCLWLSEMPQATPSSSMTWATIHVSWRHCKSWWDVVISFNGTLFSWSRWWPMFSTRFSLDLNPSKPSSGTMTPMTSFSWCRWAWRCDEQVFKYKDFKSISIHQYSIKYSIE